MNLNLLEQAIRINGVNHVVISKMDVLREVGIWKLIQNGEVLSFSSEEMMKAYVLNHLLALGLKANKIFFSEHKDKI